MEHSKFLHNRSITFFIGSKDFQLLIHSVCNQGICGRCGVRANGKNGLACVTRVWGEELLLEPKNNKVVKDLVTL